jgi:hypothetical protein
MGMTIINLLGQRFGRLKVMQMSLSEPRSRSRQVNWLCRCDCGKETTVQQYDLRSGKTKSCGCLRVEMGRAHGARINLRHGEGRNGKESVEYRTWSQMLSRCESPTNDTYRNYGARGIAVCDRWHVYENFLADMGRRPGAHYSIDRKDVNGDYEPRNCRWATPKEQNRNTRRNRQVTVRGETRTLAEWLERCGLRRETFYQRLRRGMSEKEALLTPRMTTGRKLKHRVKSS